LGIINLSKGKIAIKLQNYNNVASLVAKIILAQDEQITKNAVSSGRASSIGKIDWQKLSASHYKVQFSLDQPGWLVFLENYNPGWQLKIGQDKITSQLLNGYANGFYIDQTGTLEADLLYIPQRYYTIGLIISSLTLLAGLFYLFFSKRQ